MSGTGSGRIGADRMCIFLGVHIPALSFAFLGLVGDECSSVLRNATSNLACKVRRALAFGTLGS